MFCVAFATKNREKPLVRGGLCVLKKAKAHRRIGKPIQPCTFFLLYQARKGRTYDLLACLLACLLAKDCRRLLMPCQLLFDNFFAKLRFRGWSFAYFYCLPSVLLVYFTIFFTQSQAFPVHSRKIAPSADLGTSFICPDAKNISNKNPKSYCNTRKSVV